MVFNLKKTKLIKKIKNKGLYSFNNYINPRRGKQNLNNFDFNTEPKGKTLPEIY
jgi:hypothetical protein